MRVASGELKWVKKLQEKARNLERGSVSTTESKEMFICIITTIQYVCVCVCVCVCVRERERDNLFKLLTNSL